MSAPTTRSIFLVGDDSEGGPRNSKHVRTTVFIACVVLSSTRSFNVFLFSVSGEYLWFDKKESGTRVACFEERDRGLRIPAIR